MAKANKDGWIRHRGGVPKCALQVSHVKLRDGRVRTGFDWLWHDVSDHTVWKHYGVSHVLGNSDIMAYKIKQDPK